jgi:hypothetical protein
MKDIEETLKERPLFSVDIGGAYSGFINQEKSVNTGRIGFWTNMSFNKQYKINNKTNYLEFYLASRYLYDNFYIDEFGNNINNHFCDYGGRLALEFGRVKMGVEALGRRSVSFNSNDYRVNGNLSVNVVSNVLLISSLGKNFEQENLTFQLGVKWGLGMEKIILERDM